LEHATSPVELGQSHTIRNYSDDVLIGRYWLDVQRIKLLLKHPPLLRFYVTGPARSGFDAENSPIEPSLKGDADAFVMKLSPNGKLIYSTYLGGSDYDVGYRIAVDKQVYA
jgi:hypothetical protein